VQPVERPAGNELTDAAAARVTRAAVERLGVHAEVRDSGHWRTQLRFVASALANAAGAAAAAEELDTLSRKYARAARG